MKNFVLSKEFQAWRMLSGETEGTIPISPEIISSLPRNGRLSFLLPWPRNNTFSQRKISLLSNLYKEFKEGAQYLEGGLAQYPVLVMHPRG